MNAARRELAQRLTGTLEVMLLWQTGTDRLWVRVRDASGGDHFQLEVGPSEAMDVFHHPYAYEQLAASTTAHAILPRR